MTLVHHAAGLFDMPGFLHRKRGLYHILRKSDQGFPIIFTDDHFSMNQKFGENFFTFIELIIKKAGTK